MDSALNPHGPILILFATKSRRVRDEIATSRFRRDLRELIFSVFPFKETPNWAHVSFKVVPLFSHNYQLDNCEKKEADV